MADLPQAVVWVQQIEGVLVPRLEAAMWFWAPGTGAVLQWKGVVTI